MTFLFKADGETTRARYQITQEVCQDFKANFWGQLQVDYVPHGNKTQEASKTVQRLWSEELQDQYPTKSFEDLADAFPEVDTSVFGSDITDEHLSTYGIIDTNKHLQYAARCKTRTGTYYHCTEMITPSYSTAKSAFAGLSLMALALHYGEGVYSELVSTWLAGQVSEDRFGNWDNVTFKNVVDMTTGNYDREAYMADEDRGLNGFFRPMDYESKLDTCFLFQSQVAPGTHFVYHTSDTFIAVSAMQNFLQAQDDQPADADIYNYLVETVFAPLDLSPEARSSIRTTGTRKQAWGGYGLFWKQDDIAKLMTFVATGGVHNGKALVDRCALAGAMQQNEADRGILTNSPDNKWYNYGFWAQPETAFPGSYDCSFWVPYFSGYGGIRFVMMPNGIIYYYVSDNAEFHQEREGALFPNIGVVVCRGEGWCDYFFLGGGGDLCVLLPPRLCHSIPFNSGGGR
jgi:hypothetical protein